MKLERGLANTADFISHSKTCERLCPDSINKWYAHDAYSLNQKGCPVIPISEVARDINQMLTGLKMYKGTIKNVVGSSYGTILVDKLNVEARFVPAITDETGHRREFTTEHKETRVNFNIMFSYSGIRAWNVSAENDGEE